MSFSRQDLYAGCSPRGEFFLTRIYTLGVVPGVSFLTRIYTPGVVLGVSFLTRVYTPAVIPGVSFLIGIYTLRLGTKREPAKYIC